ncbi:MAG: PadR family transcriptional regulator [Planctomycetota bacterium]|jgi:DNA-binding PadR family transcriptional regulator
MVDLRFSVMAVVAAMSGESQSQRYGYAIHRRLETLIGQEIRLTSVYRILRDMEDQGWVTSSAERHKNKERRCITLTDAGKEAFRRVCREKAPAIRRDQLMIEEGLKGIGEHFSDP